MKKAYSLFSVVMNKITFQRRIDFAREINLLVVINEIWNDSFTVWLRKQFHRQVHLVAVLVFRHTTWSASSSAGQFAHGILEWALKEKAEG